MSYLFAHVARHHLCNWGHKLVCAVNVVFEVLHQFCNCSLLHEGMGNGNKEIAVLTMPKVHITF